MADNNIPPEEPGAVTSLTAPADQERRRYFRIAENIVLVARALTSAELADPRRTADQQTNFFALSASLDVLTQESRSLLRRIERDHRDVAEFLKVIERKIDLMASTFLAMDPDLRGRSPQNVSLSASGLAFESESPHAEGAMLELKMLLLPDSLGLILYGQVVDCRRGGGKVLRPYQVAVDFVGLQEREREMLIRHVVRRELQQLRDRKRGKK